MCAAWPLLWLRKVMDPAALTSRWDFIKHVKHTMSSVLPRYRAVAQALQHWDVKDSSVGKRERPYCTHFLANTGR